MKRITYFLFLSFFLFYNCFDQQGDSTKNDENPVSNNKVETPFVWENANVYFLLTDRFANADTTNDINFDRYQSTALLRGMMGGDIKGITDKINEGYFNDLGINAIWFTPVVEQNKGIVNEGTGNTYAYHGYWAQDWTALDPNFGTEEELLELVETAHAHGIRVVIDAVINHTGPVTTADPVWPDEWVRTSPKCEFKSYATTVNCTLVENLPDIKTESDGNVELPSALKDKWKQEDRLEEEMAELDVFFQRTGHPRAPRFYIMKWLCDFIKKYGIDGFRIDTAKHTEETVWQELRKEAEYVFAKWKEENPEKVLDDNEFYMVGEVYNYNISAGRQFDIGDQNVDYFANGLTSLINFEFKVDAHQDHETIFSKYSEKLNGSLKGKSVLNYISSHDDGGPFDKERKKPIQAGTKLLLCPGGVQIYYGDETARSLVIPGTNGDATLRSYMNWVEMETNAERNGYKVNDVLSHWQKLGKFRNAHPAVGAGLHKMISQEPYLFKRTFQKGKYTDQVLVGLDLEKGQKTIPTAGLFNDGDELTEYYSQQKIKVAGNKVSFNSDYSIVLLGKGK